MPILNGHELPVNKIAAFSYSKGFEFSQNFDKQSVINRAAKTIPFPGQNEFDLTGYKYSRMTVIGFLEGYKTTIAGSAWKVRCSCGNIVLRRSKKIRSADLSKIHCCDECLAFGRSKARMDYLKTGTNPKEPWEYL